MTLPENTDPGQVHDNDQHPRRRSSDEGFLYWAGWLWRHLVPVLALILASLALVQANSRSDKALDRATPALKQANRAITTAARVEQQDRDAQRATSYRLCTRNKVDRAFAQSRVRQAAGRRAMRALQRADALPILDCAPNVLGLGARPLTPAEQDQFVRRWERHQLTRAEIGVCPRSHVGSLPSVLRCR